MAVIRNRSDLRNRHTMLVEGGESTGQMEERNDDRSEQGVAFTTLPYYHLNFRLSSGIPQK
jgi:hypothetical protein